MAGALAIDLRAVRFVVLVGGSISGRSEGKSCLGAFSSFRFSFLKGLVGETGSSSDGSGTGVTGLLFSWR